MLLANQRTMRTKVKEPVKIRFKTLANGNQSIYLDIYKDGKRKYEFLKLYLIPQKTLFDKQQNEATMRAANAIKSKRIIELANSNAGITDKTMYRKMPLIELIHIFGEEKRKKSQSLNRYRAVVSIAKSLEEYRKGVRLGDVDKEYCIGYSEYLKVAKNKHIGGNLSKATCQCYFATLNAALNYAVRRGFILQNPISLMEKDERPHRGIVQRDYLSIEELRAMIATPTSPKAKKPFLCSCFTGLRFGDIMRLTWSNIITENGITQIRIVTEKTSKPVNIPVPNLSNILPERGNASDNDHIFAPIQNTLINRYIAKWAKNAGIKGKHITFHTARHTYATMLISRGADLYTVSKLLGHAEIKTTQIYAEIIDKKKEEAANLLNDIL